MQVMGAMLGAVHAGVLEEQEMIARLFRLDPVALEDQELCELLPLCHKLALDLVRCAPSVAGMRRQHQISDPCVRSASTPWPQAGSAQCRPQARAKLDSGFTGNIARPDIVDSVVQMEQVYAQGLAAEAVCAECCWLLTGALRKRLVCRLVAAWAVMQHWGCKGER